MPREPEPWGGELHLPRWLRWMLRRPAPPDNTAERMHEARQPQQATTTVLENADRAILGGFSEGHPGNNPQHRRHWSAHAE